MILSPFRVRGFLFQWPADLLTNCAIEMEVLMLGWFILTETKSVLLLTVFAALRYLGSPIAPLFGMAGDKFGHRRLLCAMRASYALTAAVMTALTFAGFLGPIPIFIAATFAGVVKPSDLVMRNALIATIVPPERLMTAMGAAGTTSDCSRIFGPLAGSAIIAATGLGPACLIISVCYAAACVLTAMGGRGLAHRRAEGVGHASFAQEVVDGMRYVWRTPCLHAGMWLAVLVNATVIPLTGGLMPYIARDVYQLDQFGLGCLLACFSVGAFCGSIGVSILGSSLPAARIQAPPTCSWLCRYRTPRSNTIVTGNAVRPQKQAMAPAVPRIWVPMNTARLTLVAPGTSCDSAYPDRNCLSSSQPRFCTTSRRVQAARPPPKLIMPMLTKLVNSEARRGGPEVGRFIRPFNPVRNGLDRGERRVMGS